MHSHRKITTLKFDEEKIIKAKHLWWNHLKSRPFLYIVGALGVIGTNVVDIAIPKILQWNIDELSQHKLVHRELIILFITALALQYLCRVLWRTSIAQQSHVCGAGLKSFLWKRVKLFPESTLRQEIKTGEILNIATGDVNTSRFAFGFTLIGTVDFIFLITLTLASMFWIDPFLTSIAIITLPLLPFLLNKLAKLSFSRHKTAQESLSALTESVSQAVDTLHLQRLTQSESFWQDQLSRKADEYKQKRWSLLKTDLRFIPTTGFTPLISLAVFLFLGISRIHSGHMSIGEFVAFQSYIFVLQEPLVELGWLLSEWQRSFGSLSRYADLVNEKIDPRFKTKNYQQTSPSIDTTSSHTKTKTPLVACTIKSFQFPSSNQPLLENFSLEIKHHEKVGIQGEIGSGKSTLLNILSGLELDYVGEVLYKGSGIRRFSHQQLRSEIVWVKQKPFLFANSIRENLSLDKKFTDDELWHAIELAGLSSDFSFFPDKLDTQIGEWGINLSGGQKQRIGLARALLRKG